MRSRPAGWGALALLAALAGSLPGCSHSPAADGAGPPRPGNRDAGGAAAGSDSAAGAKAVRIVTVGHEVWPVTVRVQGSLLADEDAVVGSKLAGRVERVHVDLGSVVKRGEPLVTLDRSELELLVRQAEAQLRQACAAIGKTPEDDETELVLENSPPVMLERAMVEEAQAAVARGDRLRPSNAITDAEYETFVAQLKTAQARYMSAINSVSEQISLIGVRRADLALARQHLVDAVVVAPFDALVNARNVSPGAYVQMGQAVAGLVRIDRLRFTAGVPESQAARVVVGQTIHIDVAGMGEPIVATISRLSPTVVQSSRSVRIEADVPNPDLQLQAGLFGEAEITVDAEATALAAPATAVTQFAGVQKVWVVQEGQAAQATVRIGRREPGRVEILEGLEPGASIVAVAADGHEGPVIPAAEPAGT
ncbi:MAG TPA: efflux RND transporter periplasmic adaptor subunit [Lacipirellulaceae bacterium]|nr:efflux RND transporter periplasmic adaptor subunit [Lacipirellulaceae bacterium]